MLLKSLNHCDKRYEEFLEVVSDPYREFKKAISAGIPSSALLQNLRFLTYQKASPCLRNSCFGK